MATGAVTQINADYLKKLQGELSDLLDQVNTQLKGLGTKGASSATTPFIKAVTSSIQVAAGGSSFNAAQEINSALQSMGGSVNDQLNWLKNVLTDMISDITTTMNSFSGTESLNNESVSTLEKDFQKTINQLNQPASSGSTNNPSGTTNNPSGTTNNPSGASNPPSNSGTKKPATAAN
jgi:hypothetical protein